VSAADPPILPGSAPPLLVGRERELTILRHRLDAALAGQGSFVLIAGEAGVGKTSVAEAICREATVREALVLVGHCYDLTETPPYGPWIEAFGRYDQQEDTPPLPAAFAQHGTIGPVAGQAALFQQVIGFLAAVAAQRPLVLLLEDLHWSDPASLDLLRVVARSVVAQHLLVVMTFRSEEVARQHPLYRLLPLLVREAHADRLELRPLDAAALRVLVAARYDLPIPDAGRLVTYLDARGEGNALFVDELLRSLEEAGVLQCEGEDWRLGLLGDVTVPPLLRQVIDARVAHLGDTTQRLLAVAAVIGQECPYAVWAAVTEEDEEALLTSVAAADAAHIVVERRDGTGARFTHALVREAIYEGVRPAQRRRWHRTVGETLAATPDANPAGVADHFRRAGDARAVAWFIRAGDRALQASAWHSAASDYEAARNLAGMHGLEEKNDPTLFLRLARAYRSIDPHTGVRDLADAERWCDEGHRALGCYALFYRGFLRSVARDFGRGMAEMQAGARSFDALPADERQALQPLLETLRLPRAPAAYLTGYLGGMGRYDEVQALCEWLLVEAERRPPDERDEMVGNACGALIGVYGNCGRPEDAVRAAARARAAYGPLDRPLARTTLVSGVELLAVVMPYYTERIDERRRLADEAEEVWARAREHGGMAMFPPRFFDLSGLVLEGQWDEAWALCLAGRQAHINDDWAPSVGTRTLASLALWRGESEVVWSLVRERLPQGSATAPGETNFPTAVVLQRVAAALALADGDLEGAKGWLDAHTAWLAWAGAVRGHSEEEELWARYHHAAGEVGLARAHAERALADASEPRQPLALLSAHRLLGELGTESGRYDDARTHLKAALALADACAATYERGLTLLALAGLDAAAGRRDEATAHLDAARTIFQSLGAMPALARADAIASRLAAMPDAKPSLPAGLTAREAEVLVLLARGKTNRDIADTLFLSERTVNVHINHIYTKTRVDNRAAATAFAYEHGLV
jgi:DNA-binding CsgD family transcriptional regulator